MTPVYERDTLLPVTPKDIKPVEGDRDIYKNLAIVLKDLGAKPSDDLPSLDQPPVFENFLAACRTGLKKSNII